MHVVAEHYGNTHAHMHTSTHTHKTVNIIFVVHACLGFIKVLLLRYTTLC